MLQVLLGGHERLLATAGMTAGSRGAVGESGVLRGARSAAATARLANEETIVPRTAPQIVPPIATETSGRGQERRPETPPGTLHTTAGMDRMNANAGTTGTEVRLISDLLLYIK